MIAHVAGAPLEEALLPLLGAGGMGAVLVARAWFTSRVRRPRRRRGSPPGEVRN